MIVFDYSFTKGLSSLLIVVDLVDSCTVAVECLDCSFGNSVKFVVVRSDSRSLLKSGMTVVYV